MPFESSSQQGFMYAHPDILGKKGLKEWSDKTDFKHLPNHVHEFSHTPYKLAKK